MAIRLLKWGNLEGLKLQVESHCKRGAENIRRINTSERWENEVFAVSIQASRTF